MTVPASKSKSAGVRASNSPNLTPVHCLGMDFAVDFNTDGSINTDNLAVHFNNDKINKCLERLATEQMMVSQKRSELLNAIPPIDPEQVERALMIDSVLLDTTKEELCQSTEPLFEDTDDFE